MPFKCFLASLLSFKLSWALQDSFSMFLRGGISHTERRTDVLTPWAPVRAKIGRQGCRGRPSSWMRSVDIAYWEHWAIRGGLDKIKWHWHWCQLDKTQPWSPAGCMLLDLILVKIINYQFIHAIKFISNEILIPDWTLALSCFQKYIFPKSIINCLIFEWYNFVSR